MNKTVYISISNSDDKLSQVEWAAYAAGVRGMVCSRGALVHGEWTSLPWSSYQNACWCIEFDPDELLVTLAGATVRREDWLRQALAAQSSAHRQDSIAWAEATTEFIGPTGAISAFDDSRPTRYFATCQEPGCNRESEEGPCAMCERQADNPDEAA